MRKTSTRPKVVKAPTAAVLRNNPPSVIKPRMMLTRMIAKTKMNITRKKPKKVTKPQPRLGSGLVCSWSTDCLMKFGNSQTNSKPISNVN